LLGANELKAPSALVTMASVGGMSSLSHSSPCDI
jgi:hypothetical protein